MNKYLHRQKAIITGAKAKQIRVHDASSNKVVICRRARKSNYNNFIIERTLVCHAYIFQNRAHGFVTHSATQIP